MLHTVNICSFANCTSINLEKALVLSKNKKFSRRFWKTNWGKSLQKHNKKLKRENKIGKTRNLRPILEVQCLRNRIKEQKTVGREFLDKNYERDIPESEGMSSYTKQWNNAWGSTLAQTYCCDISQNTDTKEKMVETYRKLKRPFRHFQKQHWKEAMEQGFQKSGEK